MKEKSTGRRSVPRIRKWLLGPGSHQLASRSPRQDFVRDISCEFGDRPLVQGQELIHEIHTKPHEVMIAKAAMTDD
jgi:hypothetical protein